MAAMMICFTCKQEKPETEFRWQKSKESRHRQCNVCVSAYNHARYIRYRDKIKASRREYFLAHKDVVKVRAKRYYEKNKECIKAKQKIRTGTFILSISSYLRRLLAKKRHLAKKDGPEVTITFEHLIDLWNRQNGRCALSGRKMVWKEKSNRSTVVHSQDVASIDRIDQRLGYVPGNVRLVCWRVNTFRGHFPDEELIEFCRDIVRVANNSKTYQSQSDFRVSWPSYEEAA
jgi:hypothetical protein